LCIQDKTRRDMLVLWLLDIQLTELAELRRGANSRNDTNTAPRFSEVEYRQLREIFHSFLNRETVHVNCDIHV
jgi:hypothetical protein